MTHTHCYQDEELSHPYFVFLFVLLPAILLLLLAVVCYARQMCNLDGADSTACLDVCSGYEALLPDVDDFTYRYYTVRAKNACGPPKYYSDRQPNYFARLVTSTKTTLLLSK